MIIVDVQDEVFQDNNLFNSSIWSRYIGTELWGRLHNLAVTKNIEIITGDYALKNYTDLSNCSLISIEITSRTKELIKKGAIPKILTSGESPIFAWEFFVNISEYGKLFKSVLLPKGVLKIAPKLRGKVYQTSFPIPKSICTNIQSFEEWSHRKRACVVISNRVWRPRGIKHLYNIFKYPFIRASLYEKRNKDIINLSATGVVDLYGRGWDKYVLGGNIFNYRSLKKMWKGALEEKEAGMNQYKFSMCYENTDFPGYVTEKIFDSLVSGSIPIYYGSDYIQDLIPDELFINVKKFNGADDVGRYINNFGLEEYKVFHAALIEYCKSESFTNNTYEARAEQMLKLACS